MVSGLVTSPCDHDMTVSGEASSTESVTFTNGAHTVTKSVTGTGSAQAVVLTVGDLTTLTNGTISVSATATDAAGNTSAAGATSFTLDTGVPSAPTVALGTGVPGGATAAVTRPAARPPDRPSVTLAERRAELDQLLRAELEHQGIIVRGQDVARVVGTAVGKGIEWQA